MRWVVVWFIILAAVGMKGVFSIPTEAGEDLTFESTDPVKNARGLSDNGITMSTSDISVSEVKVVAIPSVYEAMITDAVPSSSAITGNGDLTTNPLLRRQSCSTNGPRIDGRCGCDFEGATCDPSGPFGGCCSSDGFCVSCSKKRDYDSGLVSDAIVGNDDLTISPLIRRQSCSTNGPRIDGRCGCDFEGATCDPSGPFGGCCSSDGFCVFCSKKRDYNTTTTASTPGSTNGLCGTAYNGTICGTKSCCSIFGFCGNDVAHCGAGCQSGPCVDAPVGFSTVVSTTSCTATTTSSVVA